MSPAPLRPTPFVLRVQGRQVQYQMKQIQAKIVSNEKVGKDFCRMRLASAYLAKASAPGQFVEIRCAQGDDPLLRRPLGVHRLWSGGIETLYEIVGKGTQLLAEKKAGSVLDIIGPLGNGFDLHTPGVAILIAGGIGVAPLVALAEELVKGHKRTTKVVIGARSAAHILCEKEFRSLGCAVSLSTDDGSKGRKGLATDQLKAILEARDLRLATIYACGPAPMLRAVADIAQRRRIPCQVSLEERMACGVGVCLGCPVRVRGPAFAKASVGRQGARVAAGEYAMVCKDGPVFNADEIVW